MRQYKHYGNKPHINDDKIKSDIIDFYNNWKHEYLIKASSFPNSYYISTGGGTNVAEGAITVSEGHGYGMLTVALMAEFDPQSKEIFDGLYNFYNSHRSPIGKNLPSWQVIGKVGEFETEECFASATDGDLDVAYALILADRIWGSNAIDYMGRAKAIIEDIIKWDIHSTNYRILLGDWVKGEKSEEKYKNATRPSDWMPEHFKVFYHITKNEILSNVVETIYNLAQEVAHPQTGILPDFVVGEPPKPAEPFFLEKETDGDYGANACRVPWRIGMDFLHNNSNEAKAVLTPFMEWLYHFSDGDYNKAGNGFTLDGTVNQEGKPWGMFGGPYMVASTIDTKYQSFLDSAWQTLTQFSAASGYYSNSIVMLSLIAVGGYWWNPIDE